MILEQFDYVAPTSLSEAVDALTDNPTASPLAGGDGLITLLKRGQVRPSLLVGLAGHRSVPVAVLFDVGGTGRLAQGELIVSIDLPPAEPGSGYERLADRATLDAVCGVAAAVALAPGGTLARCRVAVTGGTLFPCRLGALERSLVGAAIPVVVPPVTAAFVDDRRASAEYRAELTRVL